MLTSERMQQRCNGRILCCQKFTTLDIMWWVWNVLRSFRCTQARRVMKSAALPSLPLPWSHQQCGTCWEGTLSWPGWSTEPDPLWFREETHPVSPRPAAQVELSENSWQIWHQAHVLILPYTCLLMVINSLREGTTFLYKRSSFVDQQGALVARSSLGWLDSWHRCDSDRWGWY